MVNYEVEGRVGIITINRPDKRNAINGDVALGIEAGLDDIESNDDIWIGIITGAGGVFCAGADLKVINEGKAAEITTQKGGFAGLVARDRTKPLIAAVDGFALAGGTEIVLACDLVVASTEATFGIPEVKRSLLAAGGGLFRLNKVLPRNVAFELGLTGDPITATRAYDFGMVNELSEPGQALTTALELAGRINKNAPIAVRETLRLMNDLVGVDDEAGFRESQASMMRLVDTEDFWEGPAAFLEKREPQWKGR